MNKTYCDRCKKIDSEQPVMINLAIGVIRYSNLRLSVEEEFLITEKELMKSISKFPQVLTLCADCFINFFDYKKGKDTCGDEPTTLLAN